MKCDKCDGFGKYPARSRMNQVNAFSPFGGDTIKLMDCEQCNGSGYIGGSMKPYTWSEGQSLEEQKDGAYWERNMLALMLARADLIEINGILLDKSGWYRHEGEGFDGWSRVISIDGGRFTFHVPDDFDLGNLPEIQPNWDNHTTKQKWARVMDLCGCEFPF